MQNKKDNEFHKELVSCPKANYEICDYSDTDYAEFWEKANRQYEDAAERIALRRLIKDMRGSCLEIGAGYGRLVNEYAHLCTFVTLSDYAENMVSQAMIRVMRLGLENVNCMKANLYDLYEHGLRYNNAVCVRVMHHVENVPAFFGQVNKILKDGGTFIFEYANKRNVLEIFRYLLKRPNIAPFDYQPSKRGKTVYYNFHPDYIRDMLEQNGFVIEKELAVSIFRNEMLKKLAGHHLLSFFERLLQRPLACFHPGPSVFIKARKVRDIAPGPQSECFA